MALDYGLSGQNTLSRHNVKLMLLWELLQPSSNCRSLSRGLKGARIEFSCLLVSYKPLGRKVGFTPTAFRATRDHTAARDGFPEVSTTTPIDSIEKFAARTTREPPS